MDTSFHADAVPGGSHGSHGSHGNQVNVADFFAPDALIDTGPYHGQNTPAPPPLGDPMDLDFDFDDAALWAGDFGPAAVHASQQHFEPDMSMRYCHPTPGMPADFLFAEDEGVLPAATTAQPSHALGMLPLHPAEPSPTNTVFAVPRSEAGSDDSKSLYDGAQSDMARQRLRRQLSLLSKGWAGDEIRFKNCDQSKAVVLHSLAMELGLGYNHDVRSREVSMSRLEPAQIASSRSQPPPNRLTSALSRSSTELDSALCLPGLPSVPEYHTFEAADLLAHEPVPEPAPEPVAEAPRPPHAAAAKDQPLVRRLSRGERISDSISKHVSTLKTSIAKGGRRGPLTENGRRDMRALEAAGGACWRCKVLRRKCDPGSPCRCCLQSVPMPHLGEDAPLWPLIGCRRGPLRSAVPPQLLCPEPKPPSDRAAGLAPRCRSTGVAERWLLSAESQRLADMKAVLEGASYKLSIADPALKASFTSFIEAARYRDSSSLQRSYSIGGDMFTYTELIATIAWELAENQTLLASLEIRSWEAFMGMLETAGIYEAEVGQTSLVIISMVCLRHCLEALRLHSANLLTAECHEDCGGGHCQVECIRSLRAQLATYIDELSAVMFNKENMRDRRWWLSTFYSLYIQSYVRHALITVEKQLRFPSEDVAAEELTATQYLHLPAVLFTAASAKYDPLFDGRLQYALTDNSVIPETSVPELHHSSARVACEVDKWPEAGIRTPYQFLRRLLQIGSLDFFDSGLDGSASGSRSPMALTSPSSTWSKVASPMSPNSGFDDSVASPRPPFSQNNRDSWGSKYSAQTSTKFSNLSSDSLARTMSTDMTSLYESSLFAAVSFSGSVADLNGDMRLDAATINPTALFSGAHNASSQSLDQVLAESSGTQGLGLGVQPPPAFVCSCCPRTPRHFHTSEELAHHESEKPHPCTQCKKRFKSPTEAERHLNAIHLKSDYWSCQALEDPLRAYHTQTCQSSSSSGGGGGGAGGPTTVVVLDVCGFCGGEFTRRDGVADRDELVAHVKSVHRVADCDANKKFYRADNFRQHLKNTHVALPGRWLKALERACRSSREAGEGNVAGPVAAGGLAARSATGTVAGAGAGAVSVPVSAPVSMAEAGAVLEGG